MQSSPAIRAQRQSHSESFEPWSEDAGRAAIAAEAGRPGPCLLVLQALQARFGYVPEEAVPLVAEALNLSRAEVHGVLGFYHDLRQAPPGRHVVKLCRAEACQAVGAEELVAAVERRLGLSLGQTSADGRVTLEAVFCLGNCACGPAALIDGKLHARLDAGRVGDLLAEAERRERAR